jgi:hypothetical protein
MGNPLLMQFLAISLYVLFMGFCFCDGFKLHTLLKLVWFSIFLAVSIYVFKLKSEFDLTLILPVPTLAAILVCSHEKRRRKS